MTRFADAMENDLSPHQALQDTWSHLTRPKNAVLFPLAYIAALFVQIATATLVLATATAALPRLTDEIQRQLFTAPASLPTAALIWAASAVLGIITLIITVRSYHADELHSSVFYRRMLEATGHALLTYATILVGLTVATLILVLPASFYPAWTPAGAALAGALTLWLKTSLFTWPAHIAIDDKSWLESLQDAWEETRTIRLSILSCLTAILAASAALYAAFNYAFGSDTILAQLLVSVPTALLGLGTAALITTVHTEEHDDQTDTATVSDYLT